MERRRVAFTLGVHYATNPSTLREIPDMMKEVVETVDEVQFDRCLLVNLSGSSIDFEIVYFVLNRSYTTYLKKHQEVVLKIIDKLEEHEILIPYPTQTILLERTGNQGGNQ
jgi:small-conductance mechanosensitive channel